MTSVDTTTRHHRVEEAEPRRGTAPWQWLSLAAICVLAGVLYCWGIGDRKSVV